MKDRLRDRDTIPAFNNAEARFIAMIYRASYHVSLEKAFREIDPESADLYRFMVQETILTAGHIVNWCFDQGYLTRSEAFNIKHWLYWFADPEGFCEYTDYEEFRYE